MALDEKLTQIIDTRYTAGADLSSWQYRYVRISGTSIVKTQSARGNIHGILQNKPASGDVAAVLIHGMSKMKTDGTVTAGAWLMSDTSGRADVHTPGSGTAVDLGGWALEVDGAANTIVSVMFARYPGEN